MTDAARLLLVGFAVAAGLDWIAVGQVRRRLEQVCKPLALALLTGVALSLHPIHDGRRLSFVVALIACLAGDVLLMLRSDRLFAAGLGAFLAGHLAYIVGFRLDGGPLGPLLVATGVVGVVSVVVGRRLLLAVAAGPERRLALPVALYITVVSVMVASAEASALPLAAAGALLFYLSDLLLGWDRFVAELTWAPVAVAATYHVGQALLVLSLVG